MAAAEGVIGSVAASTLLVEELPENSRLLDNKFLFKSASQKLSAESTIAHDS